LLKRTDLRIHQRHKISSKSLKGPASLASEMISSLSVFWFVTLWNDEVCDNGKAMKQCNFQNNYGAIA